VQKHKIELLLLPLVNLFGSNNYYLIFEEFTHMTHICDN